MGQQRTYQGQTYEQQADGSWQRVRPAQSGPQPVQVSPGDPMQPRTAQAGVNNTQANTDRTVTDTRITEATAPTTIQTANLAPGMMWVDPSNPAAGQTPIPTINPRPDVTPVVRQDALQVYSDADAIDATVADLRQQFEAGPGSTSGIWSIQDYNPFSSSNRNFNDAGQRARGYVKRALGFTGSEGNTIIEQEATYAPYLPRAGDSDAQILSKIEALQELGNQARQRAVQVLGGIPDANGNITPVSPGPSAMDQTNIIAPATQMQASGGTGRTSTPIPPEMQQEYQAFVLGNAANMTPEAYVQFRQGLDQKYGFESGDYTQEAERLVDAIHNGGTLNLTIPPVEQPMTGSQAINDMVAGSGPGAAIGGFTNAMTVGTVERMAGDQYGAMRDANPNIMLGGEILGTLAPTTALAKASAMLAGRVAPRLLGGGTMAGLGRGAITDATYAGAFGANTGQNPFESAIEGGVGSLGGQVLGRTVGAGLRGVAGSAPVQALAARGIPLTVGQTLGDVGSKIEQRAMSIPVIGDMLTNRRLEGIDAFNRAALSDAGRSINFTPTRTGREGVADLMGDRANGTRGAINDAYNNVVAGRSFTLDPQIINDVNAAASQADRLPPDLRANANQALTNTFEPLAANNAVSGEQWQGMRSGLSGYRAEQTGPGFPSDYRNVMGQGIDALDNFATRQGGPEVVQGLQNANLANRLGNVVQDAAYRADGANYMFTPSQLQDAIKASGRRFPGQNPLLDLADNAQQVLPSTIPNSGSADRLMQAGLVGVGGAGLGGAAGYALGGDAQSTAGGAATGIGTPAAAFLLAMAAASKGGQRGLTAALTNRNPTVRQFGEQLRRRSGLFGSAAIPLAMQSEY